jgi:hypothetical protein
MARESIIRCPRCGRPLLETLIMRMRRVRPACPDCDSGGYRMQVDGGFIERQVDDDR